MLLIFTQVLVDRSIVIENLDFHTFVSSIHTHRRTDTYTIVHAFLHEAEFKAENKVTIFLLSIEITTIAIVSTNTDNTIHWYIVNSITSPLAHVFTIEQDFKAFLLFLCREFELRRSFYFRKFFKHRLDVINCITSISIAYSFEASDGLV